jgi:hypothetical protein
MASNIYKWFESKYGRAFRLAIAKGMVQHAGFKPDTPLPIVADWYEERGRERAAAYLRGVAAEAPAGSDSLQLGEQLLAFFTLKKGL